MPRLQADADPNLWVPVTESLGWRGRRHRKAAIRMLLRQAGSALGVVSGAGAAAGPGAAPGAAASPATASPATASPATGAAGSGPRPGSGFAAWAMSQAAPFLMRKAAGRVLVWVWKADPELVVVMAQIQQATNDLRAARAMMPMEYDDTAPFRNPYLGAGEKLEMSLPAEPRTPPFATYTWDTGSHFVTVTAVCSDRGRFGTVIGSVDDLARTVRVVDDLAVGESPQVLRIEPKS